MKSTHVLLILLIISLCALSPSVQAAAPAPAEPDAPAGWSTPAPVGAPDWPDLRNFSLNDDGARLAALDYYSGADDTSRNVVVTEYVAGAWQPLTVIAQNGVYATGSMIWMPQYTHPVISGDGATIAYLGWAGSTNSVYVVDRLSGGGWSAPVLIETGLGNTHYWISLSRDGRTLALATYYLFDIDHVYVLTRTGGVWSAPVRVSAESGPLQGGQMPSLSADGRKLVYIQNARIMFTEQIGGLWTAPVQLTANNHWEGDQVEYPLMSGDGRAIIYWLVHSAGSTLTTQDLYVMRRTGGAWDAPEQVNTRPNVPIHEISQAPVAANSQATRLIYTRAISSYDPDLGPVVYGSDLEIAEWRSGSWQDAQLVASDGFTYEWWPRLTPDGMKLIFKSGAPIQQMTSDTPPAPLPLPTSTSAQIGPAGGSLYSEIDQTRYDFAPGTFAESVQVTHTVWTNLPPPPAGQISIGGIGGLGRGFAATLFGPGGLPLQPGQPVTVTVDYSDVGHGAVISGTLCLWWMDVNGWVRLPSVDNGVQEKLTATVDHFSLFAVFGDTNQIFLPTIARE